MSDDRDGHIAHLHGLNLSRAAAFAAIAEVLPLPGPRRPVLLAARSRHLDADLPTESGDNYLTGHWLATYAVLALDRLR